MHFAKCSVAIDMAVPSCVSRSKQTAATSIHWLMYRLVKKQLIIQSNAGIAAQPGLPNEAIEGANPWAMLLRTFLPWVNAGQVPDYQQQEAVDGNDSAESEAHQNQDDHGHVHDSSHGHDKSEHAQDREEDYDLD